jgi:tetratricopeptide (TPR) repeat protein
MRQMFIARGVLPYFAAFLLVAAQASGAASEATAQAERCRLEMKRAWQEQQLDAALQLAREAVGLYEKALGKDHLEVAASLWDLAELLDASEDSGAGNETGPLLERALAIREKVLGIDHPSLVPLLERLSDLALQKGGAVRARPYLERVVAIWEKRSGAESPELLDGLENLVTIVQQQKDWKTASGILERIVTLRRRRLAAAGGSGSDETWPLADKMADLARCLQALGDLPGARKTLEEAVKLVDRPTPESQTALASLLDELAETVVEQGDLAAARPLLERSLELRRKSMGNAHPDVGVALDNLALLLRALGKESEARAIDGQVQAIQKKLLEQRAGEDPDAPSPDEPGSEPGSAVSPESSDVRPLFEKTLRPRFGAPPEPAPATPR